MPADIFASHDTIRVDSVQHVSELAKVRVERLEVLRPQDMFLGPMRTASVSRNYRGEFVVEFPIRDCEAIWSSRSANDYYEVH